jgi:hypothetical protein
MLTLQRLTCAAALALAHAALLGCGPGTPDPKLATVTAGSMPAKGSWDGEFYSPLFGKLCLKGEGNLVNGRWLRPVKGEWGKLQGNADGNLLKFDWEEYNDGLVGPNSKRAGKGYFVYTRPDGSDVDDELRGEMGRGQDEVGTEWRAVKQRNVTCDPKTIGGAGSGEIGGGDWDKGNTEKGEPEEPAAPKE